MELAKQAMTQLMTAPNGRESLFKAVCKDITNNVKSTRASIWTFNMLNTAITAEALYDTRYDVFTAGAVLSKDEFPAYFAAIERDGEIIASHAELHPATSAFTDVYFRPNEICSLLDFVIAVGGVPVGVLCCEHCKDIKDWSKADENYLHQMSSLLAISLRAMRRQT